MGQEPQIFDAPDGTKMVVLPQADYQRLLHLAEDNEDILSATDQMKRIQGGEGTMPAEVLDYILDDEQHPIAAWRRYREISQAELAFRADVSQVWISRIEAGKGHGTPKTRRRIATALDAPLWALDGEQDMQENERGNGAKSGSALGPKYLPLFEYLIGCDMETVTLSFQKISDIVGGLPKSAYQYPAWWVDGGHSHADAWGNAGFGVNADQRAKVAIFQR
ncbi:MAG: helix-turn-helix transcriptional regulator [Sphingorhabdus sp.]